MGTHLFRIAAAVASLTAGAASAQVASSNGYYGGGYDGQQMIRCESVDSRVAYCRVDDLRQVRLVRQHSRTQCVQGRNWTFDARGIQVTGGCRADFQVMTSQGNAYGRDRDDRRDGVFEDRRYSNQRIRCESTDGRRAYCGEAQYRYSMGPYRDPDCVAGRTFGRDERGTWVSGRCSAQLQRLPQDGRQYGGDGQRYGGRYGQTASCGSSNRYRTYCTDGGAMAAIRDPDCVQGRTWGRDIGGTWVSGNCTVQFERADHNEDQPYYEDAQRDYGNDDMIAGSHADDIIECHPTATGRTYCGDSNVHYTVSAVRNADCRRDVNYGRDGNGTWVSGDCDAMFAREEDAYRRQ